MATWTNETKNVASWTNEAISQAATTFSLLMETLDFLLTEAGDHILLETGGTGNTQWNFDNKN